MQNWSHHPCRQTHPSRPSRWLALSLAAAIAVAIGACSEADAPLRPGESAVNARAGETPGTHRQYGVPVKVGNGRARAYVVLDQKGGTPVEVGVALDQSAMDDLPAPMPIPSGMHEHYNQYILQLPARHGTPYQFVELDWNPNGHGYPYEAPHFDFHFYRISLAERNAIVPTDPAWMAKAANFPAPEYIPARYLASSLLVSKAPGEVSVPQMGLHWLDLASPELPPASKPFTATYIMGTWDGRVIFDEPMITRAFIMSQRTGESFTRAVPVAQRLAPAGYYPDGYTVAYDAQAKEYRIALTGLAYRN
jgi:hypothetical protein